MAGSVHVVMFRNSPIEDEENFNYYPVAYHEDEKRAQRQADQLNISQFRKKLKQVATNADDNDSYYLREGIEYHLRIKPAKKAEAELERILGTKVTLKKLSIPESATDAQLAEILAKVFKFQFSTVTTVKPGK
jgi:hypothetical protein